MRDFVIADDKTNISEEINNVKKLEEYLFPHSETKPIYLLENGQLREFFIYEKCNILYIEAVDD